MYMAEIVILCTVLYICQIDCLRFLQKIFVVGIIKGSGSHLQSQNVRLDENNGM